MPIYEAYPRALLALNGLPTMQERIGNRYWTGAGNRGRQAERRGRHDLPSGGLVEDRRAWARVEGSRVGLQPDVDFGDEPDYDLDVWKLQVGIDRPVHETDDGVLIAGLTFSYGTVDADVSSDAGDGSIATDGYGFGGSLTWLRDDDLYVDGQAQLMWYDSDLPSDAVDEDLASGNDGFGYALGVEAGRRIPLKPAWTVTPQAQLIYSSVDFDSFTDPFGAERRRRRGREHAGPARRVARPGERLEGRGRRRAADPPLRHRQPLLRPDRGHRGHRRRHRADQQGDQVWGSLGVGGTYSWTDGSYAVYGEGLVAAASRTSATPTPTPLRSGCASPGERCQRFTGICPMHTLCTTHAQRIC